MPDPTLPLRNELLDVCRNGGSVNDVAQALVEVLMITLIAAAPDEASAERAVLDMVDNIVRGYREFHAMHEGLKATRQ